MNNNKRYRHFIFDFDGVISDSYDLAVKVFNEIRNEHYPSLPLVQTRADMTLVYSGSLKTCLNKWIGEEGTRTFFNYHSKRMQELSKEINPFPDIIDALNLLETNNASIVTSSYRDAVLNILNKDASYNNSTIYKIAGRELHQAKSDKIQSILNELKLSKTEAVYVGDLESDILYCREVPIDIISVGYGYHPIDYLARFHPTYLVNTVFELKTLLTKLKN